MRIFVIEKLHLDASIVIQNRKLNVFNHRTIKINLKYSIYHHQCLFKTDHNNFYFNVK